MSMKVVKRDPIMGEFFVIIRSRMINIIF